MPIKKSGHKALRQAKKHAERNKIVRDGWKQAVKVVNKAVIAGEDTKELLRLAQKKLDKAAKRGVIKAKTASRKISRLSKRVQTKQKAV